MSVVFKASVCVSACVYVSVKGFLYFDQKGATHVPAVCVSRGCAYGERSHLVKSSWRWCVRNSILAYYPCYFCRMYCMCRVCKCSLSVTCTKTRSHICRCCSVSFHRQIHAEISQMGPHLNIRVHCTTISHNAMHSSWPSISCVI